MSASVMAVVPTATKPSAALLAWPSPAYECSLVSSDIDLSLRDDLSTSVQDYLLRIVDELQQLSQWAAACHSRVVHCEQQHQQHQQRLCDETRAFAQHQQHAQQAAAALLLTQTETQLLRGEMERLSQAFVQRATTQLAYVQNAVHCEYTALAADVERRLDDKLRVLAHQTHAQVERTRARDGHWQTTDATLRAVTHQLDAQAMRLAALEKQLAESVPMLVNMQQRQQLEHCAQQRRLDQLETATAQQLSELKSQTHESRTGLRDAQAQFATKLQVVRAEIREQQRNEREDRNQKLARSRQQQRNAAQHTAPGDVVVAVGGAALLHDESRGGDDAASASDCFLQAKAALAPRSSDRLVQKDKRQTVQSHGPSPMTTTAVPLPLRGNVSFGGAVRSRTPGNVEAALRIHSSTLSQPVGREEDESGAVAGLSRPSASSTSSGQSPRKVSLRVDESAQAAGMAMTTTVAPKAPRRGTAQR